MASLKVSTKISQVVYGRAAREAVAQLFHWIQDLGDVAGDYMSCFSDISKAPKRTGSQLLKVIDLIDADPSWESNALARRKHELLGRGFESWSGKIFFL